MENEKNQIESGIINLYNQLLDLGCFDNLNNHARSLVYGMIKNLAYDSVNSTMSSIHEFRNLVRNIPNPIK